MGKYGYYVIDSDGHGGEPPQWRHGISAEWRPKMVEYVAKMKEIYGDLPGAGSPVHTEDQQNYGEYAAGELDFETPLQREGMAVPPGRWPNSTNPSTQVPTANGSVSEISLSFNP